MPLASASSLQASKRYHQVLTVVDDSSVDVPKMIWSDDVDDRCRLIVGWYQSRLEIHGAHKLSQNLPLIYGSMTATTSPGEDDKIDVHALKSSKIVHTARPHRLSLRLCSLFGYFNSPNNSSTWEFYLSSRKITVFHDTINSKNVQ